MADRIGGTVYIGGKITQQQFDTCAELLEFVSGEVMDDDGSTSFAECGAEGEEFEEIIEYCKANKIALHIHWQPKWDLGGCIDSWVDGNFKAFHANASGEIMVPFSSLQEHSEKTVAEFLASLDVPDFPLLEIID